MKRLCIQNVCITVILALAMTGYSEAATVESHCPLPADSAILLDVFWTLLDADGDGYLSPEELQVAYNEMDLSILHVFDPGDGLISQEDILPYLPLLPNDFLSHVPIINNGVIEYASVAGFVSPERFALLDSDGDGVIDCHDIGLEPPDDNEERMFNAAYIGCRPDRETEVKLQPVLIGGETFVVFVAPLPAEQSNECFAHVTLGTPYVALDDSRQTIELRFTPPITQVACTMIYMPMCAVNGRFGPLSAGDWRFMSTNLNVPGRPEFDITLTVPFEIQEGEPAPAPCPLPAITPGEMVDVVWFYVDRNRDGVLSFQEIAAFYPQLTRELFGMADPNRDGVIDRHEAMGLVSALGVHDLVALVDANGDRLIQYVEVSDFVTREQFRMLDVNNNGVLDCEDLAVLLPPILPPPPPEGEFEPPVEGEPVARPCPLPAIRPAEIVAIVWRFADSNRDDALSFQEVAAFYPQLTREMFRMADLNNDGVIDRHEAMRLLSALGVHDLVALVDANGDRLVQYVEVSDFVTREQFGMLDVNNNGVLDCEDLAALLPPIPPPPPEGEFEPPVEGEPVVRPCPLPEIRPAEIVAIVWRLADSNRDGVLSFEEAVALYPQLTHDMFRMADLNNDGVVDRHEAMRLLSMLNTRDLASLIDANGDRLIQYEEVSDFVTREQFGMLDVNNNGVLDCEDLAALLPPIPPPPPEGELEPPMEGEPEPISPPCPLPPIDIAELVTMLWPLVDVNGDGVLSYRELASQYPVEQALFNVLDLNDDDALDYDEVMRALTFWLGIEGDIVAILDTNGDGVLQHREVAGYLTPYQFRMLDANGNGVLDCDDLTVLDVSPASYEGEDTTSPSEDQPGLPVMDNEPCPLPDVLPLLIDIVFVLVDTNRNGYITLREAQRIYPDIDPMYFSIAPISPEFLYYLAVAFNLDPLAEIDTNGDRLIQYEEVEAYIPREVFDRLDYNGNDVIDCEDYAHLTASYWHGEDGECGTAELLVFVVQGLWLYADENEDGLLDYEEVEALAGEQTEYAFALLDRDQDGYITPNEVYGLLLELPINIIHVLDQNGDVAIQYEEVAEFLPREIFDALDANGDGVLDCDDFTDIPFEGEEPPVEGEEPPVEGEEPPVEGEEPPVEGEEPPVEGEEPPVEGEEPPVEGEEPPVEGEEPPVEGEEPPVEGEAEDDGVWDALPFDDDDLISPELVTMLRRLFDILDANGDGLLTYEELRGQVAMPRRVFNALDLDDDGAISRAEVELWRQSYAESPSETIIRLVRTVIGNNRSRFFTSGVPITVRLRIEKFGADLVESLQLNEFLPEGWSVSSVLDKSGAQVEFKTGVAVNTLLFEWTTAPTFPIEIEYEAIPGNGAVRLQTLLGQAGYLLSDGVIGTSGVVPTVLAEELPAEYAHSADIDANWRISLSELLRVIQLYNSGAYHVDPLGEDGFAPGVGPQEGWPHDADYLNNWRITLPELLRMIQLYNAESRYYYIADGTEDGYMPAPF